MRLVSTPLAVLLLYGPAAAAADVPPAGTKAFQGWTATCNNLGACVTLATAEGEAIFYVRIARAAGAAAAPQVKLVLVTQDPLKGASPTFSLSAKAPEKTSALGPYPASTDSGDTSEFSTILAPPEASVAFVDIIRNADTLDYSLLDTKGTLDLKGLAAALRWIDAQQGRAGTPTALVAKGMTPIGQVPEPVTPPMIAAAPAGSVSEIAKPVLSTEVLAKAMSLEDCDKDTVRAHQDAQAWTLGSDLTLVSVPCINGAYNFSAALYFTDAKGGAVRAVPLPKPPTGDDGTAENVVTNMTFDPATMTLSDFAKGRGIGDCGETRSWIWTGRDFALSDASKLDACPGAMSDDWPNTYSAARK